MNRVSDKVMSAIVNGHIPPLQELARCGFGTGREFVDRVPFDPVSRIGGETALCRLCRTPPTAPAIMAATITAAINRKRSTRELRWSQVLLRRAATSG